jgi:DNA gyrase subunit A
MARKKNLTIDLVTRPIDLIKPIAYEAEMDKSFVTYGLKVLRARALPDIRDGLKPSIRRVLLAMRDMKLDPSNKTQKSAKVAGYTSGTYHPHGSASVYQAMVRLAQPWTLRYPLLSGQGNWGSPHGDEAAADRYTEVKLAKAGAYMLENVNIDTVPHIRNYDNTTDEATVIASVLPNLICNGGSGIAVGWATNMAPHNLNEVVAVIREYVKKGDLTVDEILALMPGPDFPTGGRLLGQAGVRTYYETGRGSLTLEGTYELEVDDKGRPCINVTGFPHGGNSKIFELQIKELVETKKLEGLADMKSLIAKDTRIVLSAQKGTNIQVLLNQILKQTCLRTRFSVNATVVDGDRIRTNVPMLDFVKAFVNHRRTLIENALRAELNVIDARLHIVSGLLTARLHIDRIIEVVRSADSKKAGKALLISEGIVESELQADAVLDIPIGSLTRLDQSTLEKERDGKNKRADWIKDHLSDAKLLALVVKEQEDMAKQLGDPRRTDLVADSGEISIEDLIPEEEIAIILTKDGYIKRVPTSAYKVQARGGKGVKGVQGREADEASDIFIGSTHDHILFFTNRGVMYRRKGHEIPEGNRGGKGKHLANVLSLNENEHVIGTISVRSLGQDGSVVCVTRNGLVKRTALLEYDSVRTNTGLKAIALAEGDELRFVALTDGKRDLAVITAKGRAARYPESAVRETGRATMGVKAMTLAAGDSIAQLLTIEPGAAPYVIVLTQQGFGKKVKSDSYRCTKGRGTQGVLTLDVAASARTGDVATACTVEDSDGLLILTAKGKVIRLAISDLVGKKRTSMGPRYVDLEDGDTVVAIAKATADQDEIQAEEESELVAA